MGWSFRLEDASVVGWLTSREPEHNYDPQVANRFVAGLEYLYPEHSGFIADKNWIEGLRRIGREYGYRREPDLQRLGRSMDDLRGRFRAIRLFALAVGHEREDHGRLRAFIHHAAHASERWGLFMIPRPEDMQSDVNLSGAFPAVAQLAEVSRWPGVVFWTPTGASTFARLRDVDRLFHRLSRAAELDPVSLDELIHEHDASVQNQPRLLHLSDLHFGTTQAAKTQALLQAYATDISRRERVSRVVITGDLFDQPTEQAALAFSGFRHSLSMLTGSDPIVIPGNHDSKLFGNLSWSKAQLAELEWSNVVVDDALQMIFLCFDSARGTDLARGLVDEDQRRIVGTSLQAKLVNRPELRQYLRVVLVHHHPFSFHVPPLGIWKIFERLGVREESFLKMEDADGFVDWCGHRGASLILHGHKHVPFHAQAQVKVAGTAVNVSSVGCGSSTGMSGPIGINVLTCDKTRWSARFMVDPGDGRGLVAQTLIIRNIERVEAAA